MNILRLNFSFLWPKFAFSSFVKGCVILGVSLVVLASIFLRFHELDHIPGVNGDEALVAVQVADLMAGRPVVLKMPTGRLLSPIYAVILMGVQTLFPFDFHSLRSPAFFSGCLLIILSFFLFKDLFGFRVGIYSLLLIATHPVLMAYSRMGIEQCVIPLATLCCLYFAFRGKVAGTIFSFIVAVAVHPVNIFLVPVIVIPFSYEVLSNTASGPRVKHQFLLAILVLSVLGILFESVFLPAKYQGLLGYSTLMDRVLHWPNFGIFAENIFLLLTGLTAYLQFSGGVPESFQIFWQSMTGVFCLFVLGSGSILLIRHKEFKKLCVVVGTLISIFGFYVVTGVEAVHPGVSRYTIWMLVPFLLSISILIDQILGEKAVAGTATGIILLYAILNLGGFQYFYLSQIKNENTHAHISYRTGSLEPKQAAWEWIQADAQKKGMGIPVIMAEDWWTYWPLRYLALNQPNTIILRMDEFDREISELKKIGLQRAYFVGFPEGVQSLVLAKLFQEKNLSIHPIVGFGEQTVLNVVRVQSND